MLLSEQLDGAAEDKIFKFATFIKEISKVQDLYFNELVEKLGFYDEKFKDFLFDYCYNCNEPMEFSEYLKQFGH